VCNRSLDNSPILVTGTHRSGSTWVGHMLAMTPSTHYIHEPFAPMYERAWVTERPTHGYICIEPNDQKRYQDELSHIIKLTPHWFGIARRFCKPRHWARLAQEAGQTFRARRRGSRALVKDPFLLLSAEWFAARTGAHPVVLIRHPAAFASSIKRLGWRLDVNWLLDQETFMQRFGEPFRDELLRDQHKALSLIDHACLVWRVLNSVTNYYARAYPHWHVLRYEDLAGDPVSGFRELYAHLGLPWDCAIESQIRDYNAETGARDVSVANRTATRRNSTAAMWSWLNRLTEEEVRYIYAATSDIAHPWYGENDWPAYVAR